MCVRGRVSFCAGAKKKERRGRNILESLVFLVSAPVVLLVDENFAEQLGRCERVGVRFLVGGNFNSFVLVPYSIDVHPARSSYR